MERSGRLRSASGRDLEGVLGSAFHSMMVLITGCWRQVRCRRLACAGGNSMLRMAFAGMVLVGALLVPRVGLAQISCSREGLQRAADLYVAAQSRGDTS